MKKIRFTIVGSGRIGERHAQRIKENENAILVAVCDNKKNRADALAKKYSVKAVYSFEDLLKEEADVINICTPSGLHAQMTIEALKKDFNVLCEKPMTLNLIDAKKIVETEKETKKKVFLVKQNKYNPPIKVLKDVLIKEKLGKINLLDCNVLWNRNSEYYDSSDWRGTMKLDGGALFTQCSHFLDLMVWLGGPVKKVSATMANHMHPSIETEDIGSVRLEFENGALGLLQYTLNILPKNIEGSLLVSGSKGTIKVGGEYMNTLEHWCVEDYSKPELEKGNEANDYGNYKGSMSNHDQVIENVVQVLNGNEEIKTNSVQGVQTTEVMQAAYLSAITKKEVNLPLKGEDYNFKLNEQPPLSGHKKVMKEKYD